MEFEIMEVGEEDKCDAHPNSKYLHIFHDDKKQSAWCLECVFKTLLEDAGTWEHSNKLLN